MSTWSLPPFLVNSFPEFNCVSDLASFSYACFPVIVSSQIVILHLPRPLRLQLAHLHRFYQLPQSPEYWWPAPVTPTLKPLTLFTRCLASFDNGRTIQRQQLRRFLALLSLRAWFPSSRPILYRVTLFPRTCAFVISSYTRSFLFRAPALSLPTLGFGFRAPALSLFQLTLFRVLSYS